MGSAWYFPFYDNNGNITANADETGAIVAEYTYDAFGRTISSIGLLADNLPPQFSTKYYDTETDYSTTTATASTRGVNAVVEQGSD